MNVNKKIVFIGVGGVLLLLFVFAAIMLFRGIRQFGAAEQDLANARNQLNTFYKKKPFPNSQNVAVVEKNAVLMEEWIRDMVDVAKRNQVDPAETRSPSVFINELATIRNGLQRRAKLSKVKVDAEFGFGFDRYVEGEPATPDYVPRLIQQLLIVNEICGILIDEQVSEISSVHREQFDGARAAAKTTGRRQPTRRKTAQGSAPVSMRRAASIEPTKPNPSAGEFEDDDSIDTKIRFSFDFMAREKNLIQILNRLAQNEMFIVVTSLDIEAEEPVAEKKAPEKRATVGRSNAALDPLGALLSVSPSGASDAQEEEQAPAYKRVPSREERIVFGEKVEKPAQVHLELEVYRYK